MPPTAASPPKILLRYSNKNPILKIKSLRIIGFGYFLKLFLQFNIKSRNFIKAQTVFVFFRDKDWFKR